MTGPAELQAALDALHRRASADVGTGSLPGCGYSLHRRGEVLADRTIGAPPDATWLVWSVAKALTSGLVGTMIDDGVLDVSRTVKDVLPWFVGGGKDTVTIEQLLLHTSGLATAPMRSEQGAQADTRRERMASWRTTSSPGTSYAYHHTSAHWVLRSVIEELEGARFEEVWQRRVAGPLELSTLTFEANASDPKWQQLQAVGDSTPAVVVEQLRAQGIDLERLVGEAGVEVLLTFNERTTLACGSPGAGAVGSTSDIARFLWAVADPNATFLSSPVRELLIADIRNDLIGPGLPVSAKRTLGFVLAGDDGMAGLRELPTTLGPQVFGQPGMCGQIAWADPASGLVFVHATNGLHRDPLQWWQRVAEINALAAATI